jgi:signal transduction histidine kinase/ActR/RegA family two-component response regulator
MTQFRRIRIAILLAAAALLGAQWLAMSMLLGRARSAALETASDTVQRAARAVEASLNRNFVQLDAMLVGLPGILAPMAEGGPMSAAQINRVLRELNNQNFTFRDVLLIGENNMPVATGLPLSRRRPFSEAVLRSFFEGTPQAGAMLIGGPLRNPASGEWSLYAARRISLPGFGALLAVAEMPVPVLSTLLSVGADGAGLRISLERSDGTLLASQPHDEARIGTRFPVLASGPASGPASGTAGTDDSQAPVSVFDGRPVIAFKRPLLYPALALTASMDRDLALRDWEQERIRALVVSTGFALLVAALAGALMLAMRQRERVETERNRWRAMLENALDSMTDGFVMWDAQDRLVACNARYKDFYRVSAPFIQPGAHFDDIMREGFIRGQYPQAGADLDTFLAEMRRWHRGNSPPMERLLPDGRWMLVTERATPGGGTVGIRTDITELKRTMEEVAEARDAAAAAAEAKSQFLARMSHELRTPLNGILGFAQVLMDDQRMASDQREQLRILHEAARHLLELVNGLLDLSKIAAGRLELRPESIALTPLLERAAALLAPEISRKALRFTLDVQPGTPDAVQADPTRLLQLLLNLLSNAVKFTPSAGQISLRAQPALIGQGVRLEVQDSGPGIAPEQRHLLFRDFVQLATPGGGGGEIPFGTGLGLSIAAQLAELMGGRIGCESHPGNGALFWVELPLPLAGPQTRAAAAGPDAMSAAAAPARPMRILVADDVPANRLVARAMLTSAGHHVTCVEDGAMALQAMRQGDFDLVLMDLQMPVMDGLQATRAIRALEAPRNKVPVIAVTASVMPEQVEACREAGMDSHLAKPIDRDTLLNMVAHFAHLSHPGHDAAPPPAPKTDPGMAREADVPLLDRSALQALLTDLGQSAPSVLDEFCRELEQGAETLLALEADSAAPMEPLRAVTHRLQGVSRTLGARALSEALEWLQASLAQGADPMPALRGVHGRLTQTLPLLRAVADDTRDLSASLRHPS